MTMNWNFLKQYTFGWARLVELCKRVVGVSVHLLKTRSLEAEGEPGKCCAVQNDHMLNDNYTMQRPA